MHKHIKLSLEEWLEQENAQAELWNHKCKFMIDDYDLFLVIEAQNSSCTPTSNA
jgi:hypothetical protein